jgi:hypothetical protein
MADGDPLWVFDTPREAADQGYETCIKNTRGTAADKNEYR